MPKLFSDKEEIWRPAVHAVARLEDKVVLTLAEEARKKPERSYRVELVFENLTSAAAKRELIALLDDKDERICKIAAGALMKRGESSAAPALAKALKRIQDSFVRWNIACALWEVGPNDQSAEAILNVARKYKGQVKDELFMIVDNPVGRRHMTEEERLNFLLNYKLGMIVGYPEALEISLNPREEFERELLSEADQLFLEKHRSQVVDTMLVRLRDGGSTVAALLLGTFKEPKALPYLQKWFIESDSYYGWEGNWNELDYYQFPDRHCYEESIKHITGKPINEVIKLTEKQVAQLVQRYRHAKSYNGESELYVLFRLKPQIALEEATRKFRNLTNEERFRFSHLLRDLLPKGLLQTEVRRLLGKPDKIQEPSWFYDCGKSPIDVPYVLAITFDNDTVIKVDVIDIVHVPHNDE